MKNEKSYEVRWQETRIINIYAEVNASSKEEAIERAQNYDIQEGKNEFLEENDSHTYEVHKAKAVEIKD